MLRLIAFASCVLLAVGCASRPRIVGPADTSISDLYKDIVVEQIEETEKAEKSTEIIWNLIPPIEEETTDIIEEVEVIEEATNHMTEVMDEATEEELAPVVEEPLREDVATIDESAAEIKDSAAELMSYAEALRVQTEVLMVALEALGAANVKAADNLSEIEKLEVTIADLNSQLWEQDAEIKRQAIQRLYTYLAVMFAFGFLMVVAGGAVMIFVSKKGGLLLAGVGVIVILASAALTMYLEWVALAGLIGMGLAAVTAIAYGTYFVAKGRNAEKAVAEQTKLVEIMKQDLPDESKKEIFGEGMKPGLADSIQSKATAKRVAAHRIALKERAEPTFKYTGSMGHSES